MNTLNLGSVKIPINAATKTFAILAKRGAGKSYTAAVMAEEFAKAGIPFVVFDPIDVWWGLRLAADGKGHGLPVVVFGREHADIQLDREMGRKIARAVVQENVSCVISTFGLPKVAQRHLIAEFAEELLNINNTPRMVFVEEAHEFVPQRVTGGMGKTFSAVESLVVMGRNRGIGVTLINQRAATINKDVLTQLDTLLAFRNVAPQDRKALSDWVEAHSADGDFEKFMASLPSLPTGEGWIWSPEFLNVFERIKIRKRETFHPDREKLGSKFTMPSIDQIDIQGFISKFSSEQKESKKMTPAREVNRTTKMINMVMEDGARVAGKQFDETLFQPQIDVQAIRNDYESRLIEKDGEIRRLRKIISSVQTIVGFGKTEVTGKDGIAISGQAEMWIGKLGNTAAGTILKFLHQNRGLKYTKGQIAVACGYRTTSSGPGTALAFLKKNNLIVSSGGEFEISPNL